MKPRIRWLSLAVTPFALALLAYAQLAHAAPYVGDCAGIPNHVTGDATVADTACVIDTGATLIVDGTLTIDATSVDVKSEIQSLGKVTIRTNGGGELKLRKKASSQIGDILLQSPQNRIETKALETGNSVQVDAGLNGAEGATWDIKIDGPIVASKHQAVPQDPRIHSNVLLRAVGPISTKTIRTDGGLGPSSVKMGGIQIEAYRNGGIAADMTAIKVRATQSRAGSIIMNANLGTIFLPTGTLNTNGDMTNNQGAGLIRLLAKTLDVQPGTIISNNQSETAPGMGHQIFICVETIKYRGDGTNGLKILNDGDGYPNYFSLVNISPQGYLVPTGLTSDVNQMPWNFTFSSAELAKDGLLTIDGTEGNGELLLRADGNIAAANVSGYPLVFSGARDVTIRSRGQTLHRINVGFFGTRTNKTGLTVDIKGNFVIDANGKDGAGGIVQLRADQTLLAPAQGTADPSKGKVIIRADGPHLGDGDGGTILFDTSSVVLTGQATLSADAAPNGSGNAIISTDLLGNGPQAIKFNPGTDDFHLGGGPAQFSLTARGGLNSGNGGGILVKAPSADLDVRNRPAVDASALSSSGSGGGILLDAQRVRFHAGNETNPAVVSTKAEGGSDNGAGGRIIVKNATKRNGQEFLAVTSSMSVDGGANVGSSDFDGSIEINSVLCRQWAHANFLGSYWNCVHPNTQGEFDAALNKLESAMTEPFNRHLLKINKTQVFIHENSTKHASFFLDDGAFNSGGLTFRDPSTNILNAVHISVFTKCENCYGTTGTFTLPSAYFNEILGHETGHAVDMNRLVSQESNQPFYPLYMTQDNMALDFVFVGADEASSIRRLPCSPTPNPAGGVFPDTPPFLLVKAYLLGPTDQAFDLCENGQLNPGIVVSPDILNSIIMNKFRARNYNVNEW